MNKQARLVLALVLAGAGVFFYLQRRPPAQVDATRSSPSPGQAEPSPKASPTDVYLVAKQSINPAEVSRITTDMVEPRVFPKGMPIPEKFAVRSFDEIKDRIVSLPIVKDEIIMTTRLTQARGEESRKRLGEYISQGFRAITLEVDAVTGTTGFINQGDIIDVAATYTAGGRQVTRIILQSVEVLARGPEYAITSRRTDDRVIRGEGGGGILFTLKVTPQMAVKLAHLVDERGVNRFRLILKNTDDSKEFTTRGVRLVDVLTDQKRPLLRRPTPAEEIELAQIEILRGQGRTFEQDEGVTFGTGQRPPPAGAGPGAGGPAGTPGGAESGTGGTGGPTPPAAAGGAAPPAASDRGPTSAEDFAERIGAPSGGK
jgi:Flp pilus assembly protein CpaB